MASGETLPEASGEKKVVGVISVGVDVSGATGRLVEASGGLLVVGAGSVVGATVVGATVVVVASLVVVAGSVGSTHDEVCGIGSVVGVGRLVVVVVSTVVVDSSVVEVDDSSGRDEVVESGTVEVAATVEELTLAP